MHPILRAIEKLNSWLIPYAIGGLFVLIVFELFVPHQDPRILLTIKVVDIAIISIFVVDLLFLAWRARSAKSFFKNHWLDIAAIFPFEGFFNTLNQKKPGDRLDMLVERDGQTIPISAVLEKHE